MNILLIGANKLTVCFTLAVAAFILLQFGAGCAETKPGANLLSGEKLAYLENNGSTSKIILAREDGAGIYMEWPEHSDRFTGEPERKYFSSKWASSSGDSEIKRFSFSNDGEYFSVSPQVEGRPIRPLVISTDGSKVWRLPPDAWWPRISPDLRFVSYGRASVPGNQPDLIAVFELDTGKEIILDKGLRLQGLFWLDGQTLLYTDYQRPLPGQSKQELRSVFSMDINNSEKKQLTPAGRDFFVYAPYANLNLGKIALMEQVRHNNIWSLDLRSGTLGQITNNSRYKQNATFLPGKDRILFQEVTQGGEKSGFASLFLINDDSSGLSVLAGDYFTFNGLYTISLASGQIAYQHIEEGNTSIWISEPDGNKAQFAASDSTWLGDPSFAPVDEWRQSNPLEISVEYANPSHDSLTVRISNPTQGAWEATLRLFPGPDLELTSGEPESNFSFLGPNAEIQITIEPGESIEKQFFPELNNQSNSRDATLLVTLAVPESPPIMAWRDLS